MGSKPTPTPDANDENVRKLSDLFKQAGKPPINLVAADQNLTDDDIIQMVNAGLVASTVTSKQRADLWSQVLDKLTPHPELVIRAAARWHGSCARTTRN